MRHYYEADRGPFKSLSELPPEEAETLLSTLRGEGVVFASKRPLDYLKVRCELEARLRQRFIVLGGKPERLHPHSLVLGECGWLRSWYRCAKELRLPLRELSADVVSFTYGDLFPAMRYADGKPYRGQVYTLKDLPMLIEAYGLPQMWNADGSQGPDRYIEAQLWSDGPVRAYLCR